ncbi:MAG TPA: M3 family oligoendopeptidase, partial [Myxococcales bacterium]|nr:M3 family oligoendopeptidase [Myxococcales bacterium]
MKRLVAVLLLLALVPAAPSRAVERGAIETKYTWNTADIFANDQAWTQARADLERRIPGLAKHKGHVGESAATFRAALEEWMAVDQALQRVATYASMRQDEDLRAGHAREMAQAADQLGVQYRTASSYLRPEILALGPAKVNAFIAADAKLLPYRPFIEDILRFAPHTLSTAEEALAARASSLTQAGGDVSQVFRAADLPFPTITLSTGEKAFLDDAGYTRYRALPERADRDSVFHAFWRAYQGFERTFGATYNARVQADLYQRDIRKFKTCMEASLFGPNVPPAVYTQLLADVHRNLPTLHRYLKLRRRMMGLPTLRYEDLYAPILKRVDLHYTPEQAMALTLQAVKPLGSDYVETLRKGFASRWVDFYPTPGKRSGAYSTGVYGVHPFQLQNFNGIYEDVTTLAHESGHSMHTYLSYQKQPYVTADYVTFVAEVASTLNENLLLHTMLDQTKDRDTRLFLLGTALDNLRGTLFRQTLFAEFELEVHEMAEKGDPITGEKLTQLYLGLVRTYYGHAQGVCT